MKNIFTLLLTTLCSIAFAQTLTPAKPEQGGMSPERLQRVDQMVNGFLTNGQIPGAVVLIARNGKIVLHKAYGYSNLENKTPLKTNDIFRIASQSKAVTSLAVMMLFEEGKFLYFFRYLIKIEFFPLHFFYVNIHVWSTPNMI